MLVYNKKANGKLLLTSEYFVLNGANAIVMPTILGQTMNVNITNNTNQIDWKSIDVDNNIWLQEIWDYENSFVGRNDESEMLEKVLSICRELNPKKFESGLEFETTLEFDRAWGLGSSSSFIALIADFAEINPYELLEKSFGGSGYDIAAAFEQQIFLYNNLNKYEPTKIKLDFSKNFLDQLYFVYLEKKQNSRDGILRFRNKIGNDISLISEMNTIVEQFIDSTTIEDFENAIRIHESFISKHLLLDKVSEIYFSDYWGAVKSLGAWGGDYVLVTNTKSEEALKKYMNEKGYYTIFKFLDLIKLS